MSTAPASWTAWYRFRSDLRWSEGPTRPTEKECQHALFDFLERSQAPHSEGMVRPTGKGPNEDRKRR